MQTTLHCPPTPRWLALFDRATRALRDAARSWGDRRRTAAAQAAFNELDDRTLRDLGLHRSEIASFSARPADSPCER